MTTAPRQELIDRYAAGGPILVQASSGLTPEQGTARPGPGDWSIAQVVAHLLDCDMVWINRMKWIIAEDEPPLPGFAENAWIDRLDSQNMPVDEAAALFAANRKWIARVLDAQDDAGFARGGVHAEYGRMTLAAIVSRACYHMDHHLKFLYAKRAALGVAIYPRYSGNQGY